MAEDTATNGASTEPQFAPQTVYLKDVSYEAPLGPRLPQNAPQPNINMNLNTEINQLGPELFEVVLNINVQSTAGDKTLWLCEVKQAGAFGMRNVPEAEARRILGVFCPNYLLPYARQTISDLLIKGGFPTFLLPPVNFDALFDEATQRSDAETTAPTVN